MNKLLPLGIVVIVINTALSIGTLYYVTSKLSPSKLSDTYSLSAKFDTFATQNYVTTEIQRASFCQNLVLPTVDEWKENKNKKNASLQEKLGPALWERCKEYTLSPVYMKGKIR